MGAHVPAVGDKRDGAEHRAAGDFGDHHDGGQRDHTPGAPLMGAVMGAEKGMGVRPLGHRVRMHAGASSNLPQDGWLSARSRESRDPEAQYWIPAFAGMRGKPPSPNIENGRY